MPIAPIDIALLLVALAACGYCFMLNQRLKALQDTREGVGATIIALSESISKLNALTMDSGQQARAAAEALNLQMKQSRELSARLEKLVHEARETSERVSANMPDRAKEETCAALLFDEGHVPRTPAESAERAFLRRGFRYED